jgi:hypothetical protein
MTEYTDEADREITDARRTVQCGDLVTHCDALYVILGRVYAVDDDGTASVSWSGQGADHGIPVDRLKYMERPEAYACVEFNGHDEIDGEETSYAFVVTGEAAGVMADLEMYQRTAHYTVTSSYIPAPAEEAGAE